MIITDNSNTWQPIETAPRDGTVIISNEGFIKYWDGVDDEWGMTWFLCDIRGFRPNDNIGYPVQADNPKWWMPVPPIPVDKR